MLGKRKKDKKNYLKKIIIFLLFIFLILGLYIFFNSSLFKIKDIIFKKGAAACIKDDEQIKNNPDLINQNFFLFDSIALEESLKKKFYCIRKVNFTRKFPKGLELIITGRKPHAKLITLVSDATASSNLENIATPSSKDFSDPFIVDEEGVVFLKGDVGDNLPIIFLLETPVKLGEGVSDFLLNALKILDKIKMFGIDSKYNKVIAEEFLITDTVPKIIFRLTSSIETQLGSLQLILEQAKIDQRMLELIDLRFDKPVVRFAPKKN